MLTFCIAVIFNLQNTLNQLNRRKQRNIKAVADAKLLSGRHIGMQCIGYVPQIYRFCALSPTQDFQNFCLEKKTPGCTNALMQMGMRTIISPFPTYKYMCSCLLSIHYLSLMSIHLALFQEGYSIHCSYKRKNIHRAATASLTDKSYKRSHIQPDNQKHHPETHPVTHRPLCNWLIIKM